MNIVFFYSFHIELFSMSNFCNQCEIWLGSFYVCGVMKIMSSTILKHLEIFVFSFARPGNLRAIVSFTGFLSIYLKSVHKLKQIALENSTKKICVLIGEKSYF